MLAGRPMNVPALTHCGGELAAAPSAITELASLIDQVLIGSRREPDRRPGSAAIFGPLPPGMLTPEFALCRNPSAKVGFPLRRYGTRSCRTLQHSSNRAGGKSP